MIDYTCILFENLQKKFKFHENLTIITGILHEEQYTFMITSRLSLLRIKKFHKNAVQKMHFVFNSVFFFPKLVPFCAVKCKCFVKPDRPQMTIWCMRIAIIAHI